MKAVKILSLLLAAALMLSLTGCVTVQEGTEPSAASATEPSAEADTGPVTGEDWGKTEFTLNGFSFRTGESLRQALNAGLSMDFGGDPEEILEPWAHRFHILIAETIHGSGTVELGVVNDSEESRPAQSCTIFYIHTDCPGVTTDKGLTIGLSSDTDTMAALDQDSTYVVLGHYTNYVTYDVFLDTLYSVEALYLEDHLGQVHSSGALTEAVLARHTDWAFRFSEGLLDYSGNLSETLGIERLSMTLDGMELRFGSGGTTMAELEAAGLVFPDIDQNAFVLESGERKDGIRGTKDGHALYCAFTNYTDEPLSLVECALSQIELPASSDGAPQSWEFAFCGVTQDTTLRQIADTLGYPCGVTSYAARLWLYTYYDFQDSEGNSYSIQMGFDILSGELSCFVIE